MLAESEYRTLYQKLTWTVSKTDPDSGFYVVLDEDANDDEGGGGSRRRNHNRRDGG